MQTFNIDTFKGGWFVGPFKETAFSTSACEVAYKTHSAGDAWDTHYHAFADEINYLISGKMKINGQLLVAPVVFVIAKGEVAGPEFITDVSMIVVKVPGVLNDKIVVQTV